MKPLKRCRRRILSALGVLLLRLVSRHVPLAVNQALGAGLAAAASALKPKTRRAAAVNLALCLPGVPESERRRIMRRSFRELGKLAFEADYLWHAGAGRIRALVREVEGEDVRRRAEARGGVVYATPHLGCWELMGPYVALDKPLYCLYKQAPFGVVERFIRAGREAAGLKLCRSDARGVRQLLRALDAGHNVGILPDQVPPRGYGVQAPFFGHPAYTMTLLPKLARRAPVVFTFAERLPRGRGYRVYFTEPSAEIYDRDEAVAAAAVNAAVEQLVRRCPSQYFWTYKRFERSGKKVYRGGLPCCNASAKLRW